MPRIASRSVFRPAAGETNGNVDIYYRINCHFASIDSLIQDLQLRFSNSQRLAVNISHILPQQMTLDFSDDWAKLEQVFSIYMDIIGDPMVVH